MRALSKIGIIAATTALMVTAVSVPAAAGAHTATIAVVNGIPGKTVDVCINGKEVRSNLKYGKKFTRIVSSGGKKLKVFKRDRRKCKGVKLAQKLVVVGAGSDLTIVVTKKAPKVLLFSNTGLGTLAPSLDFQTVFAFRNGSDFGSGLHFRTGALTPITPSGDLDIFVKGAQSTGTLAPGVLIVAVAKPQDNLPFLGPVAVDMKATKRYEFIAVGTGKANARLVRLVRAINIIP